MIEFWIADLQSDETQFEIPGTIGTWEFNRRDDYGDLLNKIQEGRCTSTYWVYNETLTHSTSYEDFLAAIRELIDSCLILSFLSGACVTPIGTSPQSDITFLQLGDLFIRPRPIAGFPSLQIDKSLADYFLMGIPSLATPFRDRRMRLFLSHWISGLTCFSMEDLFLSVGVQMDIVKQCEIATRGKDLNCFEGMEAASNRYSLKKLNKDYKKMRDDLVHEGVLSGSDFKSKNKGECAEVISAALNWIDRYVAAALVIDIQSLLPERWRGKDIELGLPALSLA